MVPKKTKEANLENKRGLFFQIGLVFTVLYLLGALGVMGFFKKK